MILHNSVLYGFSYQTETDRIIRIEEKIKNLKCITLNYELTRRSIRLANRLSKIANDEELIKLTESENSNVFCIAFLVLAKRNNPYVKEYFENYLNMTAEEWIE